MRSHYVVFGRYHDFHDPHGFGATDLLVTLGNFTDGAGNVREQAGAFVHELGHNLGLRHGGRDDANVKAGYVSVMNDAYQMDGLVRGGERGILDYARVARPIAPTLGAEPAGLPAAPDRDSVLYPPNLTPRWRRRTRAARRSRAGAGPTCGAASR